MPKFVLGMAYSTIKKGGPEQQHYNLVWAYWYGAVFLIKYYAVRYGNMSDKDRPEKNKPGIKKGEQLRTTTTS